MPEGGGDRRASTRGRRNPALLQPPPQTDEPEDGGDDSQNYDQGPGEEIPYDGMEDMQRLAGEQDPDELPLLYAGDVVMGRASISMDIHGQESWFSWGVSSRIQPNESEEEAFIRMGTAITMRILDLADAADEQIGQYIERQREEARRRKIRPRQNT